ncbi:hypothetical protein AB0D08_05330 [Kitasatospora sp. NPDC048540]|uniref:hypothetical protein n=1 Tax=Kitasatospora sp. NPDC048540 TaxID=3155634 RepID=UPI0033E1FA33
MAVLLRHEDCTPLAPRAELLAAARSGAPGVHRPYLRCLAAGLRRLPSHYGGVLVTGCDPGAYVPGRVLVERAPVAGPAVPDAALGPGAGVEFVNWSLTGRRSSVFGAPGEPPAVVLLPGTGFEVLDMRPSDPGPGRPPRVLLHEAGGVRPDLGRLEERLARRDAVPPSGRIGPSDPARYLLARGARQPLPVR